MEERIYRTYNVTDKRIADKLIEMGKWQYFTENKPHWKYPNRMQKVWCFEFDRDLIKLVKDIKKDLYGNL
ncbi:hypothetical protein [Clostridium celatum]|uniref:DUF5659 domain-containing protein n=1 Tax=Clostridium celatum DSM 1785 TaxID=545697 RepID=L1QFU3_9CLOT|nr:hypothetical protein [Clostridium celatum]EKY26565.1 hypothetical protein HMPREF0216_01750 [Clostridium celatum DSM 1785]